MLPAIVILFSAIIPFITIFPLKLASNTQHSFHFPSIPAVGRVFPSILTIDYEILVTPKPDINVETVVLPSPTPSAILVPEALNTLATERFLVYKGIVFSRTDFFVAYAAFVIGIFLFSGCLTLGYITRRRRQIQRQFLNPPTCVCHCHLVPIPASPPLLYASIPTSPHVGYTSIPTSPHLLYASISTSPHLLYASISTSPHLLYASIHTSPHLPYASMPQYHPNTMEGQASTHATDDIVSRDTGTGHGLGFHSLSSNSVGIPLEETEENQTTIIAPVDPTNTENVELVEQTGTKHSDGLEVEPEATKKLPWFKIPPLAPRVNSRYHLRQPKPIPVPNYFAIFGGSDSDNEVEQGPHKESSLARRMQQRTSVDSHPIPKDVATHGLGEGSDVTRSSRAVAKLGNGSVAPVQSNKPVRTTVHRKTLNNPRAVGPYSWRK